MPPAQHPPPLQLSPAQQGSPGTPHTWHVPLLHMPFWHAEPSATHMSDPGSQQPALLHVLPEQHGWSGPPHGWQVLPLPHASPAPQLSPAQQGSPWPPHGWQVLLMPHTMPDPHCRLAQQGSPAPPHVMQLPAPLQVVPAAVHWSPVQHICEAAPHVPQLPDEHVPPIEQAVPSATHTLLTQHPVAPHPVTGQQTWPADPQVVHTPAPLPVHVVPLPHTRPAQHESPAPPHERQVPLMHDPFVHVSPAQQA